MSKKKTTRKKATKKKAVTSNLYVRSLPTDVVAKIKAQAKARRQTMAGVITDLVEGKKVVRDEDNTGL